MLVQPYLWGGVHACLYIVISKGLLNKLEGLANFN